MIKSLLEKLKEASASVLPISFLVLILYFTPLLSLTFKELIIFLIGSVTLILGIALFSLGSDMAMAPMGEKTGASLIKSGKISIALLICFIMGLVITIAEPDLSVLATQVKKVINSWTLIITVGIGVGLFLVIDLIKIILKRDLSIRLMLFYLVLFALTALLISQGNERFLSLAFDSGGVTTGPITVPFIMALGVGVARTIGGREARENSFGLIALCSIGPIIVVMLLCIGIKGDFDFGTPVYNISNNIGKDIVKTIFESLGEVSLALGLIVLFFIIVNIIFIKLPKQKLYKIGIGLIYTLVGLVLFLTAANISYMPIGYKIGLMVATFGKGWLIGIGFIIGMLVVLAEPAVHILTKQVEEVTTGAISKRQMLISLSIGVGISIGLSMIRIVFGFSILWYVIPGYIISLGLSLYVPRVYTAIAFDSGGVASGPLSSSFILPMAVGACSFFMNNVAGYKGNVLENAFGIIAMIALTPLITIQLLGFKSMVQGVIREKSRTKKLNVMDDDQIIYFK